MRSEAAWEVHGVADDLGRIADGFPLADDFHVYVVGEMGNLGPKHFGTLGVELLKASKYRGATLTLFGNPETGEVSNQRLKISTAPRDPHGPGYDFTATTPELEIRGEEVVRLRAFLSEELPAGRYRIVDANSPTGDLVRLLEGDDGRTADLLSALTETLPAEVLASALKATTTGQGAAELAVIDQRREVLDQLDGLLADPATTETDLHAVLKDEWWIFGSRFIASVRTTLLPLDTHDLALLAADGSLHIVELKGPTIPAFVRHPRAHWIVGNQVHEAALQAANYVRTADEHGQALSNLIRTDLNVDVDMRRAFATVVIGHSAFQSDHDLFNERSVSHALRTYNALISRVEVLTYDQLVDTARRSLTFIEAPDVGAPETTDR